jgi:hypothetical protein
MKINKVNKLEMRYILLTYPLGEEKYIAVWKLNDKGIFTLKSMHKKLTKVWVNGNFKHLWKAKVPHNIKILWLIWHNSIETKDNMFGRNPSFVFSMSSARYMWSVASHTLGAPVRPSNFAQYFVWISRYASKLINIHVVHISDLCWAMWKLRYRACFEKKLIKSPA